MIMRRSKRTYFSTSAFATSGVAKDFESNAGEFQGIVEGRALLAQASKRPVAQCLNNETRTRQANDREGSDLEQ